MLTLIMVPDDTKPGFTLLRYVTASYSPDSRDLLHDKYLSSKSFREFYKGIYDESSKNVDFVIHVHEYLMMN